MTIRKAPEADTRVGAVAQQQDAKIGTILINSGKTGGTSSHLLYELAELSAALILSIAAHKQRERRAEIPQHVLQLLFNLGIQH